MDEKKKSTLIFILITAALSLTAFILIAFVRAAIISKFILNDENILYVDSPFSSQFVICTVLAWFISEAVALCLYLNNNLLSAATDITYKRVALIALAISAIIVAIPVFIINDSGTVIKKSGIVKDREVSYDEVTRVNVTGQSFHYTKGSDIYYIIYTLYFNGSSVTLNTNEGLWNVDGLESIVMIDEKINQDAEKICDISYRLSCLTSDKDLQTKLEAVFTPREGIPQNGAEYHNIFSPQTTAFSMIQTTKNSFFE